MLFDIYFWWLFIRSFVFVPSLLLLCCCGSRSVRNGKICYQMLVQLLLLLFCGLGAYSHTQYRWIFFCVCVSDSHVSSYFLCGIFTIHVIENGWNWKSMPFSFCKFEHTNTLQTTWCTITGTRFCYIYFFFAFLFSFFRAEQRRMKNHFFVGISHTHTLPFTISTFTHSRPYSHYGTCKSRMFSAEI